jgi:hypothetical protein
VNNEHRSNPLAAIHAQSQAARSSPPAKARHAGHDTLHITDTRNTTGSTVGATIAA